MLICQALHISTNRIIFLGLAAHIITAIFSYGYHQSDELFQVYEFAGYKLGLNTSASMPWEFHEKMRSGIMPFIVYAVTKFFYLISVSNPFSISLFLRLFYSLLSFFAVVQLLKYVEKELESDRLKKLLWWLGLLWWCLPYFHARLSSENFSSALFLLGFGIVVRSNKGALHFMLAGFLFGISFLCRFQLGFMTMGCLTWLIFVKRISAGHFLGLACGIFLSLLIGVMVDTWLYDEPVLSWWNYLDLNVFKNKASIYGNEPSYFYLAESFLQLIPPFSIFIIVGIIFFWIRFPKHPFTFITLPFVFLHIFVAHKELRFLFPMLNLVPPMLVLIVQYFEKSRTGIWRILKHRVFISAFVIVNGIALISFGLRPADNVSSALKHIYDASDGKKGTLLYSGNDPYNQDASLNYFRNTQLQTVALADSVSLQALKGPLYFYTEKLFAEEYITIQGHQFQKYYSNFAPWVYRFNFNHWADRVFTYSIYKAL